MTASLDQIPFPQSYISKCYEADTLSDGAILVLGSEPNVDGISSDHCFKPSLNQDEISR